MTEDQNEKSQAIRALIGERHPHPLHLEEISSEALPWGTRKLVEYHTTAEERIQAYLLEPLPNHSRNIGILAAHQHNGDWEMGKSEVAGIAGNPDCQYGRELCELGYTVICPDYLGFENRGPSGGLRPYENSPRDRAWEEMDFCIQLMHGSSLCAKYIFDSCQALDVLESTHIQPGHFGAIGHSMGGQTAMWTAFFDSRVKVAFASCSMSLTALLLKHRINHNLAAFLPGLLRVGDIDDVVAGISPRVFGMSSGTEDQMFPMEGIHRIHAKANNTFPAHHFLGLIFEDKHNFPPAIREQAYALLDRHLLSGN